jgi:GT2 family glycosyltransferase
MVEFTKTIYAVIVTWNSAPWIRRALDSLYAGTYPARLIVVDNASQDDTVGIISQEYPQVDLLRLPSNLGFGRATNVGLTFALDHGADYILLLNQDARAASHTVEALVQALEKNPEFGLLSPAQLDYDGKGLDPVFLDDVARDVPIMAVQNTAAVQGIDSTMQYQDAPYDPAQPIYEVTFVQASIWMMTRKVVEKVGGFDPLFFMYGEDNDYCNRARYHGLKVGVLPAAVAYHHHSGKNYRQFSLNRRVNGVYSSLLVTLKHPRQDFNQNVLRALRRWGRKTVISMLEVDGKGFVSCWVALAKITGNLGRIRDHYRQSQQPGAYLERSAGLS